MSQPIHDVYDNTNGVAPFMRIRDIISILFLKNDFEEGEDYLLAHYRLPEVRSGLPEEEEVKEEDEESSSSGSEVDSEDEPELRTPSEQGDPYSPQRRSRRFFQIPSGGARHPPASTQQKQTSKEGLHIETKQTDEVEREVVTPARSDASSHLCNKLESNRCRGVYVATRQISKTVVGEQAHSIYFRLRSGKPVIVALQDVANITVSLICDGHFLDSEDAKALLGDGLKTLTNVLGSACCDLSSWRMQRYSLQQSINIVLDRCWIPTYSTSGTRPMELLQWDTKNALPEPVKVCATDIAFDTEKHAYLLDVPCRSFCRISIKKPCGPLMKISVIHYLSG
eukprot:gb/GECG01007043.1/.p1 GENE.gb/GECG01007043.1/~~gb/GECG01007043.1/.p1  ORF type:complete len:339 (+),score=38.66 gb/GECG01007043.1/:1-1017(+)